MPMTSIPVPGLGPAFQLGWIVRDVEAAMRHWTQVMGVGPFFYFEEPGPVICTYRGVRTDPLSSAGFAYSGDMQIELLQQRNDAATPYRDFLAAGREGVQHIAHYAHDFGAACRALEARGMEMAYKVELWGGDEIVHYYEDPQNPWVMREVLAAHPVRMRMHAAMRAASQGWDGDRPVRAYRSMLEYAEAAGLL